MLYPTIDAIEQQLQQEGQARLPMSRAELEERLASRAALNEQLEAMDNQFKALYQRFHHLPKLPHMAHVQWASAILKFPNLVFFVIDTTGVREESDIIRVFLADAEGVAIFDRIVRPTRQTHPNTAYTGIVSSQIKDASSLTDIWSDLQATLAGRYVLAYNLEFLKQRLNENAQHYGLQPLFFLGECLQERAGNYYQSSYPLKLKDVCARVGVTLGQTAPDRAVGQVVFLRAMAEGMTNVHSVSSAETVEEDDGLGNLDDDHPF